MDMPKEFVGVLKPLRNGRKNKYRAKSLATGEYVYGDLLHGFNDNLEYDERVTRIAVTDVVNINDVYFVDVDPDSVAQFCFTDCYGREVYEGDLTIDGFNNQIGIALLCGDIGDVLLEELVKDGRLDKKFLDNPDALYELFHNTDNENINDVEFKKSRST